MIAEDVVDIVGDTLDLEICSLTIAQKVVFPRLRPHWFSASDSRE